MAERYKQVFKYRIIHEDKDGNIIVNRETFNFDTAFNLYDNHKVENGAFVTLQNWEYDLVGSGEWVDIAVRHYK